jgi:hypothetical protein
LLAELTVLLLSEPVAVTHLLTQHMDDGTRHCRVCTAGGQTGRYRYPCLIRLAAEQAQAYRRSWDPSQE